MNPDNPLDAIRERLDKLEKAAEPRDSFVACLRALEGLSGQDRSRLIFALMSFFGIEELEGVVDTGGPAS